MEMLFAILLLFLGCFVLIGIPLWIYWTYLIWEVNFAKKRVSQRSKFSPSNKDVPKVNDYDSNINLIHDLEEKHPDNFKSEEGMNSTEVTTRPSEVIRARSYRRPSFQIRPLTLTQKPGSKNKLKSLIKNLGNFDKE